MAGYRPPSETPQGRWARFLHARRRERDWSQTRAFEELREGLGLGPRSRAAYVAIDMGRRPPKPAEVEFLTSYFGASPDEAEAESASSPASDDLVAAIYAQTAALGEFTASVRELVDELRSSRSAPSQVDRDAVAAILEFAARSEFQRPVDPAHSTGERLSAGSRQGRSAEPVAAGTRRP